MKGDYRMAEKIQIVVDVDGKAATKKLNDVEVATGGVEKSAEGAATSVDGLSGGLGRVAVEAAKAWAAFEVGRMVIGASSEAAKKYQAAMTGLASVARFTGQNITSTLGASLQLSSDGMLQNAESAKALQNLLQRGFGLDQATKLIDRFKDSAAFGKQASLSFGEAVVSATEGLKNENSILVDNAGVTKNVSVMWKEYAVTIGTTADKLTLAQKRQAEYNGIMIETEAQVGNAALAADSLTGAEARLSKSANDGARAFGEALTPALIGLNNIGSKAIESFAKPMTFMIQSIGVNAGFAASTLGVLADAVSTMSFSKLSGDLERLNKLRTDSLMQLATNVDIGIAPQLGADSGKRKVDPSIEATKRAEEEKLNIKEQGVIDSHQLDADRIQKIQEFYAEQERIAKEAVMTDIQREDAGYQRKQDKLEIDMQFLRDKGFTEQEIKAEFRQTELDLEIAHAKNKADITEKIAIDSANKKAKAEAIIEKAKQDTISVISNAANALMQSKSRAAFEVGKAASIGIATIKTIEGAQSAYASAAAIPVVGWSLAPIAAGAAIAMGVANVSKIAGTSFGGGGAAGASSGSAPSLSGGASQLAPQSPQVGAVTKQEQSPSVTINVTAAEGLIDPIAAQRLADSLIPHLSDSARRGLDMAVTA